MANATANAVGAQSSRAPTPPDPDDDLPWSGRRDQTRQPPANLPKFIDVPNAFLRYAGASWTVKLAFACDRYRFLYGRRLDRGTLQRWTGVSRSTAYRALVAIEAFVDADGYLLKGIFDDKVGGYVRVLLADVWEVGILRAMALALLRRWARHPKAVVGRDSSVRVVAPELAHALGIHEKTARRMLQELSTGTHRKVPGKRHVGRFLLKCKGGRAPFVLLLSKPAQLDSKAQRAAALKTTQEAPKESAPSATQQQAVASKVQAQDAPPPDDGASTLHAMKVQLAMRVLGEFVARCQKPKPRKP
jgi:hypothetical protein